MYVCTQHNPFAVPMMMLTVDDLRAKYGPSLKHVAANVYRLPKCFHGSACIFIMSSGRNMVQSISCDSCATELTGGAMANGVVSAHHSDILCRDYNCMCVMRPDNVLTFLQFAFAGTSLPYDVLDYMVPFYIDVHRCSVCRVSTPHTRVCSHCSNQVCKFCISETCDRCDDMALCSTCVDTGATSSTFVTLSHSSIMCNLDCIYKLCRPCCTKGLKRCGWCAQYLCPFTIDHTCAQKLLIVDMREYQWLQAFTEFDRLFAEACDWYFQVGRTYDPYALYDAMKIEALETCQTRNSMPAFLKRQL